MIERGSVQNIRESGKQNKRFVFCLKINMENNIEYQIFIGCTDPQSNSEEINEDELREMVVSFFKRKQIDFSLYSVKGGYLYKTGKYAIENSLCINIIGQEEINIIQLAKSLSMYMNQECSLITKNYLKTSFQ